MAQFLKVFVDLIIKLPIIFKCLGIREMNKFLPGCTVNVIKHGYQIEYETSQVKKFL